MARSLAQIVIEWMAGKGPAEWHGVAHSWNWDHGVEPMLWILEQPCDKATALEIFWRAEAFQHLDRDQASFRPGSDEQRVAEAVLRHWSQYEREDFAFSVPGYARDDRFPLRDRFRLTPSALRALKPLLVDVRGEQRYPDYSLAPAECQVAWLEELGQEVSPALLESVAEERAGRNLSATAEEVAARARQDREEVVSFLDWMMAKREELAKRRG